MTRHIERFKIDLERLIKQGDELQLCMNKEVDKAGVFKAKFEAQIGKERTEELFKKLPFFRTAYEPWYSEAVSLLRQLLPDRLNDFVRMYEKPKGRKSIGYENYVTQDYMQDLRVTLGGDVRADPSAALPQLYQQVAIVKAAKIRFESSLFEICQLVQADLFDSELDAARELLRNKFYRGAGAIAGVVIEKHLRQVCDDHKITIIKKHPGIGDLNELLRLGAVIDVPQWRHISMLADIRSLCDHNKQTEPSKEQVSDLIDGTSKILKIVS